MSISIADCSWPPLPDRYLSALKGAVAFVLGEFPQVVGLVAAGSIVRGCPDPASDLDLCVIHRADFRQRVQAFFCGVPAEIFVNPPRAIEGYFREEARDARPLTAHMLATGHLVAVSDPVVTELLDQARTRLAQLPAAPADLTQARYMLATMLEDAVDVSARDRLTSTQRNLWRQWTCPRSRRRRAAGP